MTFKDYGRDNFKRIILHITAMAALCAFLILTGTSPHIAALILIVWLTGLVISAAAGYMKQKKNLALLWDIYKKLPEKYLFCECIERPVKFYERQWLEIMRLVGKSMIEEVSAAKRMQKDYREYIENWVHEIKVPITAIQLICENNRSRAGTKIVLELSEIERQVEQALFYARSDNFEKDFIVRKTKLADTVNAALSKNRTLLIQNNVRVDVDIDDTVVYSDSKWLEFVISQLLSNSVKYKSSEPVITISSDKNKNRPGLTVADNGIGISAAELPRIFSKGFTGSNGRSRGGATGMGLYLCKKLASHLDIDMSARSAENEGTSISLHFSNDANLSKM